MSEFPSQLRCAHCAEEFDPDDALEIRVIGPSTALYMCPRCGKYERSIPPQNGASPADTDESDDETRRGFLKAAGTGAIGAVSVGTLAGDAGAADWPACEGNSASVGPGADSCGPPGIADEPKGPARSASIANPPIGYKGIKDIRDDALCLTLGSGCTVWSVASLVTPVPGDEVLVVGSCAIVWGACTARQILIGMHGRQSEWSIYRVVKEHGTANESRQVKRGDMLVLPGGD